MAADTNTITIIGRLTKDAETKTLPSGTQVIEFRLAFNSRVKRGESWEDKSGFVGVSHFARSEKLAGWLVKGKQVAVTGSLRFDEWETSDGSKRSTLDILASDLQLLGGGESTASAPSDLPVAAVGGSSSSPDDIPFAASRV